MELILSICMIANPGTCREEALSVSMASSAMPTQCMIGAAPIIAEWSGTHPKWKVLKWRCARPGSIGRDI